MSTQVTYAKRLVKGSAIVYTALLAAGIVGLLLRMVMARSLSVGEYGLFYAVFAIISFFELFRGLGFDAALVKHIPEFMVKKQYGKIKSTTDFVILAQALMGILIAIVFLIFSGQIALGIVKATGLSPAVAVPVIQILAIWFILMSFNTLLKVFQGFQNMPAYATIKFFDNLLLFLLAFLFVGFLGLGVSGAAYAYLFTALATGMLSFAVLRRMYPQVFRAKASITKPIANEVSKFAFPIFLSGIILLVMGLDTILITAFRTPTEVGYYQAALPLAAFLSGIAGSVLIIFLPMVSELWARREKKLLGNMLYFLTKFSFILVTPAVLIFVAFPDVIINIFFGANYQPAMLALQILSVVTIVDVVTRMLQCTLIGIGKPAIVTKVVAAMASLSLVGNLLLIPPYGIVGAAVAALGAYVLGAILLFYYVKESIKFTVPASPLLKTVAGGILTLLLISGLKSVLVMHPLIEALAVGILGLLFYVVWILASGAVTREDLSLIARIIPVPAWLLKAASKLTRG